MNTYSGMPLLACLIILLTGIRIMNNETQKPLVWLNHIHKTCEQSKGIFQVRNKNIILEWEKVDAQSAFRINEIVRNLSDLMLQEYAKVEFEFAQKRPHEIANDWMLKSLAEDVADPASIDWDVIKQKINDILQLFFAQTDWAAYVQPNDVHFFVIARDAQTKKPLGLIQFLVTPDFPYGSVRTALYGVSHADPELAQLLMSSIFMLIKETTRIFLHIRATNDQAFTAYSSWGFAQFPGPLANWTDMEYRAEQSGILQHVAHTLLN